MLRKKRKTSAIVTLMTYLVAFVLPNLVPTIAVAQTASPVDAKDLAWTLGIAPIKAPSAQKARQPAAPVESAVGVPSVLNSRSPLSAAVLTTVGGRGTQFSEVSLLADWDGKEDLTAERGSKIADLSSAVSDVDGTLTRSAISAHTFANGFNENVYYYGDSIGNVYVGVDTNPGPFDFTAAPRVDVVHTLNLPTILNAFGTLQSDDQIVVTGVCVSPVVDLTAWANVNGAFAPFAGQIGESLIVTFTDTGSGVRLAANNQIARSGVIAFPIADGVSPAAAPPAIQSPAGFPVTVGGSFGVVFSTFSNLAGCAVDDDGSVYFQQVDLQQFTGANIVKISRTGDNQDRSVATSGILTITTLTPAGGLYGTTSGPPTQINRYTNYSGTSTTFGNIAALAAGPGNTLYAALAPSADSGAAGAGLFANPAALGPTPSMIVSFADALGLFNPNPLLRLPDSVADSAVPGASPVPGVNNFRVFVQGNGPDRRGASPASVFGTTADTLKVDLQVDYTIYSGLAVNEDRQVFVIHGGTPAGIGRDPSPAFGEIQIYPDRSPADRRGDYVDLRGNQVPVGPTSGGNAGDGDSDRYDHIYMQAPIDIVTVTPTGLAGLATGFLRYTNRLAPNPISPGITLGQTAGPRVQGDDQATGPIFFGQFDPGFQVGGGDDQNPPFTGDDAATTGSPAVANPLEGGFEFNFGAILGGVCTAPWNAFFLNSNGSVSFNAGSTDFTPTSAEFLSDVPRIAPMWRDLNPNTRAGSPNTFPLQAIGFAGVNHFKVRWINVPQFGQEATGSRNTFSVSLFDDGTAVDENAPLNQEGPTDSRFTAGATGIYPAPARPNGSAAFTFEYGWMDTSATIGATVVGYSIGLQGPASVAEVNLSELGRNADIGTGAVSETAIFEVFSASDFDLRSEGNDPVATMLPGQGNPSREILDFFGKACDHLLLPVVAEVVGSGTVTGLGISCPGDCTETVPSGGPFVLTATPAAGWLFSSWVGCDGPSGNVCTVIPTENPEIVTAQFVPAPAQPPLSATLNQASYTTGNLLVLTITLDPALAGPGPVDAYILVDTPTLGTFSILLGPIVPGTVPIVTNFTPIPFSGVLLAAPLPGSLPAGAYQFRTYLTQAGTSTVIGSVDVTPFTFTP